MVYPKSYLGRISRMRDRVASVSEEPCQGKSIGGLGRLNIPALRIEGLRHNKFGCNTI